MPMGGEIVAADEDYEEIYHQLKCFRYVSYILDLLLKQVKPSFTNYLPRFCFKKIIKKRKLRNFF